MFVLWLMLAVLGVIALANGLWFWVLWRRIGHHPFRIPEGDGPYLAFVPVAKRRGGARIGLGGATWPLATFEADNEWLRVTTFFRQVWIPRPEVSAVVRRGSSVRFVSNDGRFDGVTLRMADRLLSELRSLGWPVAM